MVKNTFDPPVRNTKERTFNREFTKEQLIECAIGRLEAMRSALETELSPFEHSAMCVSIQLTEIALAALTAEPSPELVAARAKIEWLSGKLNAATDCKCDGATFYDASGRERCASCGRDI